MNNSTLEDSWAILRQYSRFEQAVSDKNFQAMASIFTPDADIENRLGPNVEGESIEQRFVRRFAGDAPPTKIFYGNPLVDVDGDRAHSEVDSLVIEVDLEAPSGLSLAQIGRYYDDWRRENGTWLIYNRKHIEMNPRRVERASNEGY